MLQPLLGMRAGLVACAAAWEGLSPYGEVLLGLHLQHRVAGGIGGLNPACRMFHGCGVTLWLDGCHRLCSCVWLERWCWIMALIQRPTLCLRAGVTGGSRAGSGGWLCCVSPAGTLCSPSSGCVGLFLTRDLPCRGSISSLGWVKL